MKRICWLLILILLIGLTGCAGEPDKVEEMQEEETVEVVEEEVPKAEPPEEPEAMEAEEEPSQPIGWDLLQGLVTREYQTLLVATELSGEKGLVAKTTAYYKELNVRTETEVPDQQKYVMIIRGEDGLAYQYTEGMDKGIMVAYESVEDMVSPEMEAGMELPDLDEIRDKFNESMIVREEKLDGRDVIYVEFSEMGDVLNQVMVKLWFLKENGYPIRQEMYSDGKLLMRSNVTRLEMDISLEDSLFVPPDNVDFIAIMTENGFGMPEVPMPDTN